MRQDAGRDPAAGDELLRVARQGLRRRPGAPRRPRAGRGREQSSTVRLVPDVQQVGGDVEAPDRVAGGRRQPISTSTATAGRHGTAPGSRSRTGPWRGRTPRPAGSPRTAVWRTPPTTYRCQGRVAHPRRVDRRRGADEVGRHRRQQRAVQIEARPRGVRQRASRPLPQTARPVGRPARPRRRAITGGGGIAGGPRRATTPCGSPGPLTGGPTSPAGRRRGRCRSGSHPTAGCSAAARPQVLRSPANRQVYRIAGIWPARCAASSAQTIARTRCVGPLRQQKQAGRRLADHRQRERLVELARRHVVHELPAEREVAEQREPGTGRRAGAGLADGRARVRDAVDHRRADQERRTVCSSASRRTSAIAESQSPRSQPSTSIRSSSSLRTHATAAPSP